MNQLPKYIKTPFKPVYKTAKFFINELLDFYDKLSGIKNPLIPPRNMIFIGDGDYKKIGEEFFTFFKEFGELKPTHKILDVGCGIGRMVVPLTQYLSSEGEYYGFDIVKEGIKWCTKNISSLYPNFHFEHSNIYNKLYNPKGTEQSSEYKFNYKNEYFDFVFLTSVFTHMPAKDISNYLGEISRVMKSGSKCLITLFLLNEESNNLIKNGFSTQHIIYQFDEHSYTVDKRIPENAVGFEEEYIKKLFIKNGLKINEPIYYGSWCGRKKFKSYQDIIISEKL